MNEQRITYRQAVMWFVMHQLGSAFLLLPGVLTAVAKQDAWMSIPVALLLYALVAVVHIALAKQIKDKSFGEHLMESCGKWGGRCLLLLFVIGYSYLIFILALRDLGDFLTVSVFPETPVDAIYIIMLIAILYVVRSGIEVIGRAAELVFFFVMLLVVLGYASLIPSIRLDNLLPVLEFGWKPVVHASFPLLVFPYCESVLFLFLIHRFSSMEKWKKALIGSSLISCSIFFIVTFIAVSVLGEAVVTNLTYPSYYVVGTISIGDFYERFEVLVAVLWYITIFFRLSLLMYVSVHALADAFHLQEPNSLLIPLALIAFMMANAVWPNITAVIQSFQVWPLYALIFSFLIPLLIWLAGKAKSGTGRA